MTAPIGLKPSSQNTGLIGFVNKIVAKFLNHKVTTGSQQGKTPYPKAVTKVDSSPRLQHVKTKAPTTPLLQRIAQTVRQIFAPKTQKTTQYPREKYIEHIKQGLDAFNHGTAQMSPKEFIEGQIKRLKADSYSDEETIKIIKDAINEHVASANAGYLEDGFIDEAVVPKWAKKMNNFLDILDGTKLNEQAAILKDKNSSEDQIKKAIETIKHDAIAGIPSDNPSDVQMTKAQAQELTKALKAIGTENPAARRLVSYELGRLVLKPVNTENPLDMEEIQRMVENKGIKNPDKCGADMWRAAKGYVVQVGGKVEVDGTTIRADMPDRDQKHSNVLKDVLNRFYRHVGGKDDLFTAEDMGEGQGGASGIGAGLKDRLDGTPLSEDQKGVMQRLFGLGGQELFTRRGEQCIPPNFREGEGNLQVAEFSGAYVENMSAFRYGREVTVNLKDNGHIEYIVSQPITLKDKESYEPLGACRVVTRITFDEKMQCKGQTQSIEPIEMKTG